MNSRAPSLLRRFQLVQTYFGVSLISLEIKIEISIIYNLELVSTERVYKLRVCRQKVPLSWTTKSKMHLVLFFAVTTVQLRSQEYEKTKWLLIINKSTQTNVSIIRDSDLIATLHQLSFQHEQTTSILFYRMQQYRLQILEVTSGMNRSVSKPK